MAAEFLFQLLGRTFVTEGKKAVEWNTKIKTLGVVFSLAPGNGTGTRNRYVTAGHTETRIVEFTALIDAILERGAMSSKEAESLRGRLQ